MRLVEPGIAGEFAMRSGLTRYFRNRLSRARCSAAVAYRLIHDRLRYGQLAKYLHYSENVPGWTRGDEAVALARAAYALQTGAILVEIGSFLGSGTILMAGARRLRGSGTVHCVDPFDGSGDSFSRPHYARIGESLPRTLREQFDENLRQAGVSASVEVHPGTAEGVGTNWRTPIDLLFLDGDQSPEGARRSFDVWSPFLKSGGVIALHNSSDQKYARGHDGYRRVVVEKIKPPEYGNIYSVGTTTFATKL